MRYYPIVLFAAALAGCEPGGVSGVEIPDSEGTLRGSVFVDRNGNGRWDAGVDATLPAIRLLLRSGAIAASAVSDANGLFPNLDLAVGTYDVSVDAASIPDSLEVAGIDSARVTVAHADTSAVIVQMGYPRRTVAGARTTQVGRRVITEGVLLNNWGTFGDSIMHLSDGTSAIRITGAAPTNLGAGDSVRVLGRVTSRAGTPALGEPSLFPLGTGAATPTVLPLADALGARGGTLDAALVRVRGTISRDPVLTTDGDALLTLIDGAASLSVILDRDAQITSATPLRSGAELETTGVLIRSSAGPDEWHLKPRFSRDITPSYPLTSVQAARTKKDTYVRVRGVALNAGAALADRSVHISEGAYSIRVYPGARSSILEGDVVEVLGDVVTLGDGQPAITGAIIAFVASGPQPDGAAVASTASAATANGGILDAALIRIDQAPVTAVVQQGTQTRVTLDDGSGPVNVVVQSSSGLSTSVPKVGQKVSVRGLLLPSEPGKWALLLRGAGDLIVH